MVNIKEANEDIKKIAARNNTAVFIVGDMFNEQINNNFHYDYQRLIDEVSKANGRDMTRELIEQDILSPLPYGEYEINFDYGKNTAGQYKNAGNIALISSLYDDIGVLYHEAGHILQTEYNLFNDKELNNKYGKSLSFKDIFKYKSFLKEQHSESFAFAAMMLRSEKAFDLAKSAIKAWKRGVKHSALAFSKTSDSYNNNNAAFYATFPVMIKTIRECLKIRRQGQTQQFFTPDGRLDDKKLALLCQDIVYKSAYSPQKFKNFFIENLQDKTNKIDYIYKKGKMHFLKGLAFFVPNNKDWDKVKQKQQALMDKNKAKIEDLFGVSYEDFKSSRISVKRLSEMGHLTQMYLKKILLNTKDASETKLALEAGADANAQDEYGTTALMRANTAEQTKLLINAGADVNAQDYLGFTALSNVKTAEQAKLLVQAGVDINAKDKYGYTILMNAKTAEQIKALVEAGADVNAKDKYGNTVLMKAKTAEQIKALVEAGADINAKDDYGYTVLMNANTAEQIKALVEAGADVNIKDKYGNTALMKASTAEQTKLLIEAGADVNAHDIHGDTALMKATTAEQTKLLVEAGADVNAKNRYGVTALMKADTLEKAKQLVLGGAALPDNFNSRLTPEEIEELKQLKTAPKPSKKNLLTQKLEHLRNLLKSNKHKKAHTEIPEKSQSDTFSNRIKWSDFPSRFNDDDTSSR